MYSNTFFPMFTTAMFFGLYTSSISYEFDKLHKNIYDMQSECKELRMEEISRLKLKTNIYE
jgi:hypothetical protein